MDYQDNYQKYLEKQAKIDVLLALHDLLVSASHNAIYLQNFDIDNIRIVNKVNEAIREVNNLIYDIESEESVK